MAGCRTVLEAASNPRIDAEARGAFDEVSPALQAEFDFSAESMDEWKNQVFSNLINPLVEDSLERVGGDPIRKLGVNDRLIGPIRLWLKHGIRPLCLARTAACALFFDSRDDAGARHLHNLIEEKGAVGALREITGLERRIPKCAVSSSSSIRSSVNTSHEYASAGEICPQRSLTILKSPKQIRGRAPRKFRGALPAFLF